MSNHTPGPWRFIKYEQFGDTRFDIAQENGAPYTPSLSDVATLVCHVRPDYLPIQESNARLIAAAPELLDVADAVFKQLGMAGIAAVEGSNNPLEALRFKACAAIAKATGG